jgi:hypothetical protein
VRLRKELSLGIPRYLFIRGHFQVFIDALALDLAAARTESHHPKARADELDHKKLPSKAILELLEETVITQIAPTHLWKIEKRDRTSQASATVRLVPCVLYMTRSPRAGDCWVSEEKERRSALFAFLLQKGICFLYGSQSGENVEFLCVLFFSL